MYLILDRKRCLVICFVVLAVGLFAGSMLGIVPDKDTFGIDGKELKIVIDAGHGMPDGGTVGVNGSVESDLNLDIALKLSEIFEGKGIGVVLTRDSKDGVRGEDGWNKVNDMRMRLKTMRSSDADLFMSIHMNHFPQSEVSGLRLFYSANHKEIKPLAENIQNRISELTGAKVTAVSAADKRLFLMKSPPLPAILIECGFLSNNEEERKLLNDEYRAKIAWAIADTVEKHYLDLNE